MSDMQRVLDSAQNGMEDALVQRGLGARLAGTRVLQSFVAIMARQLLTLEQQEQVEAILELHEQCVRR